MSRPYRRHRWQDDVCTQCGCKREVRDVKQSPHGTSNWILYRYQLPDTLPGMWQDNAPECTYDQEA